MKTIMKSSLTFILLSLLAIGYCADSGDNNPVNSKPIKFSLQLVELEAIKTTEKVDELFMAVTSYPSKGRPLHREIPSFPRYWLSSHIKQIQNLSLWRGMLQDKEKITIQLSLIERDQPPFDTDDLIGTVTVKIVNNNNNLKVSWSMPNSTETGTELDVSDLLSARVFTLKANGGEYITKFSIKMVS
jgi:hypothetical protein